MEAVGMKTTHLYGGNMSAMLPVNAQDVSEVRQVPDNQEVFVHPGTDQSVIIEILEYVQEPDEQAIRTHFDDLAESNDAEGGNSNVLNIELIPFEQRQLKQCDHAYSVCCEQLVSKFKESARNKVEIYMGLFRIPEKETDILITFNNPLSISPQSSSKPNAEENAWTREQFRQTLLSLNLINLEFLG